MTRLVVANLDFEMQLAQKLCPGPHPRPSASLNKRMASFGRHLDVFARPGDKLWLASTLADPRINATVVTEPPTDSSKLDAVLAWGETDELARLRRQPGEPRSGHWIDQLWSLSPRSADVAAQANDRRWSARLARSLNVALPGAMVIETMDQLVRHLEDPGHELSSRWVLKAPFSAAGRERVLHTGPLDPASRSHAQRLLARYGALCFEPWLDRVTDLATAGVVAPSGTTLFPTHFLTTDARGVVREVTIDDARSAQLGPVGETLEHVASEVATALGALGYRGGFSVDSFVYRSLDGTHVVHPLCEVNARLTFGLVARAYAERKPDGSPYTLRLTMD